MLNQEINTAAGQPLPEDHPAEVKTARAITDFHFTSFIEILYELGTEIAALKAKLTEYEALRDELQPFFNDDLQPISGGQDVPSR